AGGAAGLSVDIALYPIDTIKTRLQSSAGFIRSGGFRGVYSGFFSMAAGSAPSAAAMFFSYELMKNILEPTAPEEYRPFIHVICACVGETCGSFVRNPFEVIKQRAQVETNRNIAVLWKETARTEGLKGFYRGYGKTIIRDIPFAVIEYPVWEYLKRKWSKYQDRPIESWQSAACGSLAGGLAAALTTPLDVLKTRVMLAERKSADASGNTFLVLRNIWEKQKFRGLFSGLVPRVTWISLGGGIYFGVYEWCKISFNKQTIV
ncbi:uncharacterized protein TRIADDRAFT_23540, partial [Trichoplax adhaerens]